jgi:DNA-binding NarL/FixJ family response regulator
MIRAIHLAHRGESLLQPAVAAKLLAAFQETASDRSQPPTDRESWSRQAPAPAGAHPLSERERQVLQLVAQGASNLQIARKLHLAEGTVKNHISLIMDKLSASNRTQAVTIARQRKLIE